MSFSQRLGKGSCTALVGLLRAIDSIGLKCSDRRLHSSLQAWTVSAGGSLSGSPRRPLVGLGVSHDQGARAYSSSGGSSSQLTHTDTVTGKASMVDVSEKIMGTGHTLRSATARGKVWLNSESAYRLVKDNVHNKKGDVLSVSQLAGIMGAKQTANLIPLCHPLLLSHVDTVLTLNDEDEAVDIEATVKTVGPTGVEMEALTAVSVAALTVYDMCKAASKNIRITDVFLVEKLGGKSGHWRCDEIMDVTGQS